MTPSERRKQAEDKIAQRVGFYIKCENPDSELKIYRPHYLDIGVEGFASLNAVELWNFAVASEIENAEMKEVFSDLVECALSLQVVDEWRRGTTKKNIEIMRSLDELCKKAVNIREQLARGEQ